MASSTRPRSRNRLARLRRASAAAGSRFKARRSSAIARRLRELLEELADAIESLVDLLHAGGEAEPHVRVEPAVVPGDDRDVVLLEQRRGEADGIGDRDVARLAPDVCADIGKTVER